MKGLAPGPWSMVENSWKYTTIYDADGRTVCNLDIGEPDSESDQEAREARQVVIASLIVAAPALYDCLDAIASLPRHSREDDGENVQQMALMARAALSKVGVE